VEKDKKQIRKDTAECRKKLNKIQRWEKSSSIQREILALPAYRDSRIVMVYLNFREEVETALIVQETLGCGKKVAVPYCPNNDIIPCLIKDIDHDVRPGKFGVPEPLQDRVKTVEPGEIDLVLVPGVAFDLQGNRLGYGKGYYDRFLPKMREGVPVIGLAFACQLVESIEAEEHDFKMTLLVTENGIIYPG